ncbi:uncharacterized protein si:ch211-139g16.8 isoform X2 [Syngnathoides biaculeatus]|uniref:uncharacterized protein si:ch211-139g16.8 isoform X2 n=1 Tax=Syngnathoides biaculeatus TaxID=300417 RepID=UPI002ADD3B3C|nr:uncharacterized protein si:ch211-139g16.8 isoform X2 [Syngnathoides biaculeatus]
MDSQTMMNIAQNFVLHIRYTSTDNIASSKTQQGCGLRGPEGAAEPHGCLSQPNRVIWREPGQDAEIQCGVRPGCSARGLHYEWFAFERRTHGRVNLAQGRHKYSLQGAALQIVALNANDSGVYYCAATSRGEPAAGAQHVGLGTTLVVKEKTKLMVGHVLMWLTFVVLAFYSSATLTLIIQKKFGLNICNCRRTHKGHEKSTNKTRIFRDVLQEMHHRREVKRSKQTARRNPVPVEVPAAELNVTHDDIYQNV